MWQHQHPGVIVVDTARANSTTNDDAGDGPRGGNALMSNELHEPDTGVVTVFGSTCYSTMAPGRRPQPGERTHPITLYDSDETILGNSDTESDNDDMMPEAVIWAANLVSEFKREQCADIDSIRELRAELVELANTIDAGRALQQVTVRFPSESNMSWEARGAALMEDQPDYSTAMKLRLQSPHQDDVNWERYANIYVQMLALLQLVADDLHAIWPMAHGGEARFRRLHTTEMQRWARMGEQSAAEVERTETLQYSKCTYDLVAPTPPVSAYPPEESWRQSLQQRGRTVDDVKRYWGYMFTAMQNLRSPQVVMAAAMAAMAAMQVTAVHWNFAQTDAM